MKDLDIVKLLTIASGYDRFIDASAEPTRAAWLFALAPYDPSEVQRAVLKYYEEPDRKTIQAAHVVDLIKTEKRLQPQQIEADVRSAKARQMIRADWPHNQPLPRDVAATLAAARSGENMRALPYDPSIHGTGDTDHSVMLKRPE